MGYPGSLPPILPANGVYLTYITAPQYNTRRNTSQTDILETYSGSPVAFRIAPNNYTLYTGFLPGYKLPKGINYPCYSRPIPYPYPYCVVSCETLDDHWVENTLINSIGPNTIPAKPPTLPNPCSVQPLLRDSAKRENGTQGSS